MSTGNQLEKPNDLQKDVRSCLYGTFYIRKQNAQRKRKRSRNMESVSHVPAFTERRPLRFFEGIPWFQKI